MLNGDVLTDIDLTAELAQHERTRRARHARALSRWTTRRATASSPRPTTARVEAFIEKGGGDAPTNRINAGAYVIERDVVERDPGGPGGLVRARGVPVARRRRPVRLRRRPATGSTSGRRSATSRRPGTCSRGGSSSTLPPRDETGSLVYQDCLVAGAHVGPQSVLGPALLGRHRRARGALGAPRPRARGRRRRGRRGRARRARARRRARADRARRDRGRRRRDRAPDAMLGAGARVDPGATVSGAERVS